MEFESCLWVSIWKEPEPGKHLSNLHNVSIGDGFLFSTAESSVFIAYDVIEVRPPEGDYGGAICLRKREVRK